MSSARSRFTFASVLTTALVAAALGAASVMWLPAAKPASEEPLPVSIAQFTDSIEVVAPEESLAIDIQPTRMAQIVGDDVVLEARVQNKGNSPLLLSRDGVLDLFVQRIASPRLPLGPGGLADVSFLALCEVVKAEPTLLLPGQVIVRTLRLGSSVPFDRPGRYVVGGKWHGDGTDVAVSPFEVVIEECSSLACRKINGPGSGA